MAATATKSPARKVLYAAIGAGGAALEKARTIPSRVIALPETVVERAGAIRDNGISLSPTRVRSLLEDSTSRLVKTAEETQKRATKLYTQFSRRGEKVVKRVQRSAPVKQAATQTKQARSRVKAAATSVAKAASASGEAAKTAVETATSQPTEQQAG